MRPFRELIDYHEAKRIVMEHSNPVMGTEEVPLLQAVGRVLAEKVEAKINVPGFVRAAMDGYAVIAKDTFGASRDVPISLELLGTIHAGEKPSISVTGGTCVQIATGAPMPEGADAVVMVEETETVENQIKVGKPVYPEQNVSAQDSDIKQGQEMFHGGEVIIPARLGVLAALGYEYVGVRRKPLVRIFPTGDEVVTPGKKLDEGQIYDINSYTLTSLFEKCGASVELMPISGDSKKDLQGHLESASEADMAIFSGGSSVGERDLLVDVVSEMGELLFHGVALKPGKPTIFGLVNGVKVFGLPGYPMSCLTNAYVLVAPALRKMSGVPDYSVKLNGRLTKRIVSTIGRHQILTVSIEEGLVTPLQKESGTITSISLANGYIEIGANIEFVDENAEVEVTLF